MVEKPPRNSARFCGGGWAVEPRKEREFSKTRYWSLI
jgi:hypothetical protein